MISAVLKVNRDASAVPASAGMSSRCTASLTNRSIWERLWYRAWEPARSGSIRQSSGVNMFDRVQQILAAHGQAQTSQHTLFATGSALVRRGCSDALHNRHTDGDAPITTTIATRKAGDESTTTLTRIDRQVLQCIQTLIADAREESNVYASAAPEHKHRGPPPAYAQERIDALAVERQRVLHFARKGKFTEAEVATELNQLDTERAWAEQELERAQMIKALHASRC